MMMMMMTMREGFLDGRWLHGATAGLRENRWNLTAVRHPSNACRIRFVFAFVFRLVFVFVFSFMFEQDGLIQSCKHVSFKKPNDGDDADNIDDVKAALLPFSQCTMPKLWKFVF